MIPQGHPQLSFQGSSLPPTRHMITPLYVMSMTCYLHMISEQFWKKVACGVDEWVNACCDILLRRERSRDNFLVDRLSGLPRITEYLLSMLCIPWYEIDLMLRLTWTQKLTFYFVSLPTENLNSVATLLTHWSFQPAFTWVLSPLPLLSYPIHSLLPFHSPHKKKKNKNKHKKSCCILIPWTFSYIQTTLNGGGEGVLPMI